MTDTRPDLAAILRRWSTYGGMGNDRSADDYTDPGCRILAEHAFRDVPALRAEVERLTAHIAAVGGMLRLAIDLAERSDAPDRVPTRVVRTIEQLNRSALADTES